MSNEELRAAIEAVVVTGYGTAIVTSDPDAYAALYTEDAYWSPPDEIDKRGKPAIRATIAKWLERLIFKGSIDLNSVRAVGDSSAAAIGSVRGALELRDGSGEIPINFTVFWLLDKQDDGKWLISNQFWTINAAPFAEVEELTDEQYGFSGKIASA